MPPPRGRKKVDTPSSVSNGGRSRRASQAYVRELNVTLSEQCGWKMRTRPYAGAGGEKVNEERLCAPLGGRVLRKRQITRRRRPFRFGKQMTHCDVSAAEKRRGQGKYVYTQRRVRRSCQWQFRTAIVLCSTEKAEVRYPTNLVLYA